MWMTGPRGDTYSCTMPYDWLVTVMRGLGWRPTIDESLAVMNGLGQPLWTVPHPAGWPDTNAAWTAPAAIRERLRVAENISRRLTAPGDPRIVGHDLLGDDISTATRSEIDRAESRQQALALLMMAPEFQRR